VRKELIIDDLQLLRIFREVGRLKSFSRAADSLRLELPSVSKKIAKLENSVGFPLFRRSTRKVNLTIEGDLFLRKVEKIFESLSEIEESFLEDETLRGKIRVACLPGLAHRILAPLLAKFTHEHPLVSLELELSDRIVDIIDERIDVAIRVQEPKGQDLIFRKLFSNEVILVASPAYLREAPSLRKLEDLKNHRMICLPVHRQLKFKRNQTPLSEYMTIEPVESSSGLFLTELALTGLGVVARSRWDVDPLLKKNQLQQVLANQPLDDFGSIYVVSAGAHTLNKRTRAFIDALLHLKKS